MNCAACEKQIPIDETVCLVLVDEKKNVVLCADCEEKEGHKKE